MRPISYVGILSRLPEIEMKEINFSNARLRFNTLGFKTRPQPNTRRGHGRCVSRADIHGYSILVHFGAADLFNKMGRCWAGAECCVYVYGFGQFFKSRGKFRLRRDETISSCAVAQFPSCVTTVRPLILMTRGGRGDRKAVKCKLSRDKIGAGRNNFHLGTRDDLRGNTNLRETVSNIS